jgi:uncharacterized membrane protein
MNRQDTVAILLLVAMMAVSLPALFGLPLPVRIILMILYVGILTIFSLVHGTHVLGTRDIIFFFCISSIVTYLMEWMGTHFGIPFGHYYYTSQMGLLIMDVPVVIPLQWFNILYACYVMTIIVLGKTKVKRVRPEQDEIGQNGALKRALRFLAVPIVVGLFMVSWDFINDPYMVGVGMWIWTNPNEFFGLMLFGIPLSNFFGWVLTSGAAILLFEVYKHRDSFASQRVTDVGSDSSVLFVIVPYLYMLIYQAASGITMGVFSFAAIDEWVPIALASICMMIAALLTLQRYLLTSSYV